MVCGYRDFAHDSFPDSQYMVPASLLNPKGVLCPSEATLDYSGTMRSRNLHWIPVGGAIIVGALARVFV